jgi:DedD protein
MKESNELNDIILNKGGSTNSNKKIILAVATLGVILIIVVMLMNTLSSNGTDNLPQAVLPPEPKAQKAQIVQDEPLFEEVEVVQETSTQNDNLDKIAKKLKAESQEEIIVEESVAKVKPAPKKHKPVVKPKPKPAPKKAQVSKTKKVATVASGNYYIQVGSFSKYAPNKKFLNSITSLGYSYKYHKVTRNSKTLNKVLVGPFNTSAKAKDARRILRAKVEPGAFLVKL